MWVRGLKHSWHNYLHLMINVAPCVGAWIETSRARLHAIKGLVAPCVGAWIETDQSLQQQKAEKSHPVWVRGLKLRGRQV